jgi:hypothetical protein
MGYELRDENYSEVTEFEYGEMSVEVIDVFKDFIICLSEDNDFISIPLIDIKHMVDDNYNIIHIEEKEKSRIYLKYKIEKAKEENGEKREYKRITIEECTDINHSIVGYYKSNNKISKFALFEKDGNSIKKIIEEYKYYVSKRYNIQLDDIKTIKDK